MQLERLTGEIYKPYRKGDARKALVHSVRPGSIVEVLHAFLLAQIIGRVDVRRRDLVRVMDEIEDRGGIIRELSTGDETPKNRRRIRERAFEAICSHARGKRSAANGALSTGAPRTWPRSGQIYEGYRNIWGSRRYTNDNQRRAAIVKNFGDAPSRVWLRYEFGSPHSTKESPPPTVKLPKHRRRAQFVYFIQNGNAVKIGVSHTPSKRMSDMSTHNHSSLKLLGVVSGGLKRERSLHKRFAKHHIKGEWFKLVPQIVDYIRKYRRKTR